MKTYTVTQRGGYQVLRTFNKQEALDCLKEHLARCSKDQRESNNFYICEQGKDDKV